jgi:hypothetical protein
MAYLVAGTGRIIICISVFSGFSAFPNKYIPSYFPTFVGFSIVRIGSKF